MPDWHPLRDETVIRPLEDSPYARDVQRLSRQELQRLLHGAAAEQDLLGLLTAARGGLSGTDLEELTGTPLWEVEQVLHTVAGRTFTRRASQGAQGTGPEVYLLGHEELHTAACRYLGGTRLAGYHERLHEWADTYRAQGWPPETPEYLLGGYFRLLTTLSDLPRLIACAGDLARHDRMLDVTGGDAAALTEVRATLDLIASQDAPDLASALRLAFHRNQLTDRNSNIPASLPAVWAALGQVTRAQALATSITSPDQRAQALARVAGALAGAGQHQQAEATAHAITNPYWRAHALADVAGALARAGHYRQAEAAARAITSPDWQAHALTDVARALAGAGQHQQAAVLAAEAQATAHAITNPHLRAQALADIAGALAEAGQHQRAAVLAAEAEATARAITDPDWQAQALADVARALAEAGQHQQAEAAARAITDPDWQGYALAQLAEALAMAGDTSFASRMAAAACEAGLWTNAAKPVLILDPSAFATIEPLMASKKTEATDRSFRG